MVPVTKQQELGWSLGERLVAVAVYFVRGGICPCGELEGSTCIWWCDYRCVGISECGGEEPRSPELPLGGCWISPPASSGFSTEPCLPLADTSAPAGVDLRGCSPAAAETRDRARDGGGRAREVHICFGNCVLPGIVVSRRWLPYPTCLLRAEISASQGNLSNFIFILSFLIFVPSLPSLSRSQGPSTFMCLEIL